MTLTWKGTLFLFFVRALRAWKTLFLMEMPKCNAEPVKLKRCPNLGGIFVCNQSLENTPCINLKENFDDTV